MRVLITTFGEGDAEKMVLAMRSMPYDTLVLVGEQGADSSPDFDRVSQLESMAGHEIVYEELHSAGFSERVDEFCELVMRHSKAAGPRAEVCLNISGGTKLLGDVALLGAFRMGVPAYYVGERVVRLPVMTGATTAKMFTSLQSAFIRCLEEGGSIEDIARRMGGLSAQSVERLMREMKKIGLVEAHLESGKVFVSLTPEGVEAAKALAAVDRVADARP